MIRSLLIAVSIAWLPAAGLAQEDSQPTERGQVGQAAQVETRQQTVAAAEPAAPEPPPTPDRMKGVDISELRIAGAINDANISFTISFDVETSLADREFTLIEGDVVMRSFTSPTGGYKLRYNTGFGEYVIGFKQKGTRRVEAAFAVRPQRRANGEWREARFDVPASQVRRLSVVCDRTDLEVLFPDAMRVERSVVGEKLTLTAILGPGKPLVVRWKPQVQALDAKLIASVEANTVATASAGALRQDTLMIVDIAQGKLSELRFKVPESTSVTQVRGPHIRDWSLSGQQGDRTLTVVLNREQDTRYALQLLSENPLPAFPAQFDVPVIEPIGLHTRGNLSIGTNSAIALRIDKTSGLSQIDNAAFPRMVLDRNHPRPQPSGKAFSYSFAAVPYAMTLSLSNIVPSYNVQHRLGVHIKEDDLVVSSEMTLDVRDAPVRSLTIESPAAYNVANVSGALVGDFRVLSPATAGGPKRVEIQFAKPLIGSTLIALRLELGRGPLGIDQKITTPSVVGAKTQRGHVVVSAERGVRIDESEPSSEKAIKGVHIGSVPMRVADAQYAYRFRGTEWSLNLLGSRRQAGVSVEAFHLHSISDGIAYGTVVFNYFITGSPIDELKFVAPASLKAVEFVGRDVARTSRDGDVWTIKLNRKVIGDYNLAVTFNQSWEDGGKVTIAKVHAMGIERQAGYVMVTSHLNLDIAAPAQADGPGSLLAIDREEVPANYRLLAYAPILRNFKYAAEPVPLDLSVDAFDRVDLLAVVVEIMDVRSDLSVRDDSETESITKVRYHVKNTSRQFMPVVLPAEARVLRVEQVDMRHNGGEGAARRLAAARDPSDANTLQVPLRRNANPNEPIVIELEYSQRHGVLGFAGNLALSAPRTQVPATFADWHINVPDDWSIRPAGVGGNMVSTTEASDRLDLGWVGRRVTDAWGRAVDRHVLHGGAVIVGLVVAALGVLVGFLRPRYVADWFMFAILAGATFVGAIAAGMPPVAGDVSQPPTAHTASFEQAMMVDSATPLAVSVAIVPDWREHVTLVGGIVVPALSVLALAAAMFLRRLRPVLISGALAGGLYTAAQFAPAAMPVAHALTWGIPALLLALFLMRAVVWPALRRPELAQLATAAVLIGAGLVTATGCVQSFVTFPIVEGPVLENVEADLAAEQDSMTVKLRFKVHAAEPLDFALLDQRAVLLSTNAPDENVTIVRESGAYIVKVARAGVYECQTEWITPLAEADDDQVRRFEMPLPVALSNKVTLTVPKVDQDIFAPTAIMLRTEKGAEASRAEAAFGPTDNVVFAWRPRARQRTKEQTVFYAKATSAYKFDAGLIEGRHLVEFQIAQGVLKDVQLKLPAGLAVTSVQGADLGTWRFEPATNALEVRLSKPAAGDYTLGLTTQRAIDQLPHRASVGAIAVEGAARSRATVGVVNSPMVYVETTHATGLINVDDFARDAATLLKSFGNTGPVRYAIRVTEPDQSIPLTVNEVKPELRAAENATFSVADERLTYNGQVTVAIAKAGRFSTDLRVPAAFDIDSLTAEQVSHWDERTEGDWRRITVHFRQQLLGPVTMNLTLSRTVSALPQRITAPRVDVVGALKHTGRVIVTSERGVSLTVESRSGLSELNPQDMGVQRGGALAYKLLRPDWSLTLRTEVIDPLITADFLHVADVSEGVIDHAHYIRYRLQNAGAKFFDVTLPDGAVGVQILGPKIARREKIDDNSYRVELTGKWFDRPYPLTVKYETRFDRAGGKVLIAPAIAEGTDRQRGHVAVRKSERIELRPVDALGPLRPADARNIHQYFGAGDLSSAVFCYSSNTPAFTLNLSAARLDAAKQLEATVKYTKIESVLTESGQSVNRATMELQVGAKRLLEVRLPSGARVWSVAVNGRSVAPSRRDDGGERVLLVPLAQASMGELPVKVVLIYVMDASINRWSGRLAMAGPRFDLPLKQINWSLFVPAGYEYDDFAGTLTIDDRALRSRRVQTYDSQVYTDNVIDTNVKFDQEAKKWHKLGRELAQQGQQYESRQALDNAWNFSQQDPGLNEDIRIDLHNLREQQAKAGLVGNRGRIRTQNGVAGPAIDANDLGDQYTVAEAERVLNTLDKEDAENLNAITRRLIEVQEEASGQISQLSIEMPLRGRVLEFSRPLQVEESADMQVEFTVGRPLTRALSPGVAWAVGLFALLAVLLGIGAWATGHWVAMRDRLTRQGAAEAPAEGEVHSPVE